MVDTASVNSQECQSPQIEFCSLTQFLLSQFTSDIL